MPERKKLFLTMFQAEMEDSYGDVLYLSSVNEGRFSSGEITNYVYNENKAFLEREAAALKALIACIDTIKVEDYKDVGETAAKVDEFLKTRAREQDEPQAVYGIISRKIKKVLKYIMEYVE
jgi:hypothetical protein